MSPADSVLDVNDRQGVLCIQLGSRGGRLTCNVRFWYQDKKTRGLRPSKRGIALPAGSLPQIIQALQKVVAQMVSDGAFEFTAEGRPPKFHPDVYPPDF